ncbi:enoyl-CoA hydratase-related protein [Amycolatopsis ultiminotia]|uniref:Enoyl-CoA hydratase-related protein n=1 Tax=Amycolatopsis ultiminotia TaxID=543629 RepID=A0ABP6X773_9PSEU
MPCPSTVTVKHHGSIATVGLVTTETRLALSPSAIPDLVSALDAIERDSSLRCVVFTGVGDVFATGADLTEIAGNTPAANAGYNRSLVDLMNRIDLTGVPTLAAINGHALGGGLELALACDLRIAADTATLALPETRLGLVPGAGGTQRLPRLIGEGPAKNLLLTGRAVDAAEARQIGLVSEVVPRDDLPERAQRLATTLARNAPLAVRTVKAEVTAGRERTLVDAIDGTHEALTTLLASDDLTEGLAAFRQKRRAEFTGR